MRREKPVASQTPNTHDFCHMAQTALKQIDRAVEALDMCEGKLTSDEYKELRARLGHLMDTLYRIGDALSKST
jgi:hypothetical protein